MHALFEKYVYDKNNYPETLLGRQMDNLLAYNFYMSNIPDNRVKDYVLGMYSDSRELGIYNNIVEMVRDGLSVLLHPTKPGLGSTSYAYAIIVKLLCKLKSGTELPPAHYISLDKLMLTYKATMDGNISEYQKYQLDCINTVPLLVIDDYGKFDSTKYEQQLLYVLLDGRFSRNLSTMVISYKSKDFIDGKTPVGGRLLRGTYYCELNYKLVKPNTQVSYL